MKYIRSALEVDAEPYEVGKNMEDGFELWSKVVTNGWISTNEVIQITRPDGSIVCPFIQNRRGIIFLREGDFIIYESDGERHVCNKNKFPSRYQPVQ